MSGNYRGGGGTKDFKADPIKGYLSARSMAVAYAKDLCVAGKITLEQIPDYADRMTVLQYGQIEVDPKVDVEVMRLAARIKARLEKEKPDPGEDTPRQTTEPSTDLCDHCDNLGNGCQVRDEERPIEECHQYYDKEDAEADAEERRQKEEEHERAAEVDAQQEEATDSDPVGYECSECGKTYKAAKGLANHMKKEH